MKKGLENLEEFSKFKRQLIELILIANEENLERLRKAYPGLVKKFRGEKIQENKGVLNWIKKYWAEVLFIISIIGAMFFILRGTGYF